ncbi:hypothetical protein H9X86_08985 [Pseudoflavonifractor capillosus]|uniref:hypothetical protein n=1 Tax=Pseudoflavonifractor capillosus TaxID=106588 RepID=UPI00195BFA20|nr:hypothetical protein [Pseudoflavonifractor capillosus]MBM6897492.1 hypothetical protein [Pseudoflavonifractor capillosus]
MRKKKMIALGVVVLVVVIVLAWLVVPGRWVAGVDRLTADGEITASRYEHMESKDASKVTLTQEQAEEFQKLMEDTLFIRRISSGIRSQPELTHYDFTVELDGGEAVYVSCVCGSGDYVTVTENGKDTALRPIFPGWEDKLEQILNP